MALLDSLQNLGTNIGNLFRPATKPGEPGAGIAQMQVPWEVTAPQYPLVNPYSLAMTGYGRNELVYTCINKRMDSVSEAPLREWDGEINSKESTMLENTGVIELLRHPNDIMNESDFWAGTSLYKDIGGFAAWEKQYNRRGEVIALYPMRPDWCSFRRGPDRLRAILRYQPAGLPFVDVPVERCVIIMDPHPIWMGIRPLSKSMVAMRITASDNAATDFIAGFMQKGAVINGLLSVAGSLQNTEADRLRERWQETHSGDNMGKIAVLGNGSTFQKIQMDFKEMDFTNLDGRDEARICAIFGVSPILIGAKLGLTGSTFSNYKEARQAYYDETITPLWKHFAAMVESQLLPDFLAAGKHYLGFDLREIKALQEDRSAIWDRAIKAMQSNGITRDEARAEMKLDPIDNEDVFVGMTIRSQSVAPIEADPNLTLIDAQDQAALGAGKQPAPQLPATQPKQLAQATTDAAKAIPLEDRSGVMVGFFLSTHDARQITPADNELPPGAVREDTLHLTLAFLGKSKALEAQKDAITSVVDTFSKSHGPMDGYTQGVGKFIGVEDGTKDCLYASYDAANLATFRTELVAALDKAGVPVATDHGFVPHIALAYVPQSDKLPAMTMPRVHIVFAGLTLAWGNEHHVAALTGNEMPAPDANKALTAWRKAALANVGAGVGAPFDDELKGAKTKSDVRAIFDKHWHEQSQADILPALLTEIRAAREAIEAQHG